MDNICEDIHCTGCGMCSNVCSVGAITMSRGEHGFMYPQIDISKCVNCGVCKDKCPSNTKLDNHENIIDIYAAWSKNKAVRKESTSGGVFSVLSSCVISQGGYVAGVAWDDNFHPRHYMTDSNDFLSFFRGSKYSQSITSEIYLQVKRKLDLGKEVLFSGTPCQCAGLKNFLGRDYDNLILVDVVCHGVTSNEMLDRYYSQFGKPIKSIQFRKKDPYWDYSYVYINFQDGSRYKAYTVYDDFFNLFNVGYSLRNSCHECKYTNTHRIGDITLADYWGFTAHSFKTKNYNFGTSLVLINSAKGASLFSAVKAELYCEKADLNIAVNGNKCLSEPFKVKQEELNDFWLHYDKGLSVHDLNQLHCKKRHSLPKHVNLRRLYLKWKWIIK